jgi:hypothetical protein
VEIATSSKKTLHQYLVSRLYHNEVPIGDYPKEESKKNISKGDYPKIEP